MKNKRFLFILIAGLIGVSLAQAAPKQTLTVWIISWPQPVQDSIDAWAKANPDIDLKVTYFGSEDLKTQTRLAVDAGKAPDILMTNAGTTFWEYVDKNAALDLSAAAREHKWDNGVSPSYFDVFRRQGKLYAIPVSGPTTWQTLFLNAKLFKDNGVAYPKTVDELVNAAKALKKKNVQTIAFGDKDGWPAILLLGDFFLQEGAYDMVAKINAGQLKYAESPTKAALEAIVKLAKNDVFMSGYLSSDHNLAIQSWAAGKTAALYNGSWWFQVTQTTNLGFPIDVIPLPLMKAGDKLKGVQLSADMCLFVTPTTKSKDAAFRFFDFQVSKAYQKVYNEASGSFPIYPGVLQDMNVDPVFKLDPIASQLKLPATGIYWDHAFPIPVIEVMKTAIQGAMQGQISVDEALRQIQAKADEVRGK